MRCSCSKCSEPESIDCGYNIGQICFILYENEVILCPVHVVFQILYDYLHSNLQPWFEADVQAILDEPDITTLRGEEYIGMHIRRTDKDLEVKHTETKVRSKGARLPM